MRVHPCIVSRTKPRKPSKRSVGGIAPRHASFKRLLGSALDKLPFDDTARDAPPRRCCHEALLLDGNFVPMRAFHFYQPEFFSVLAPDNQVGTALGDLGVLVDRLELRS